MLPHLRRLPERVDRILTLTGRGELRIRTVIDEDSRRIVRTLVNRSAARRDRRRAALRRRRAARRRRRRTRRRRRRPACSRCSATAVCSPAPCSCCGSSPRSPGTARRERRRLDGGRVRPPAPSVDERPPGERYYRHPGDVVRLVVLGVALQCSCCCSCRSPPRPATACATTSAARSPPCPTAVRQLLLVVVQIAAVVHRCRPRSRCWRGSAVGGAWRRRRCAAALGAAAWWLRRADARRASAGCRGRSPTSRGCVSSRFPSPGCTGRCVRRR